MKALLFIAALLSFALPASAAEKVHTFESARALQLEGMIRIEKAVKNGRCDVIPERKTACIKSYDAMIALIVAKVALLDALIEGKKLPTDSLKFTQALVPIFNDLNRVTNSADVIDTFFPGDGPGVASGGTSQPTVKSQPAGKPARNQTPRRQ